MSLSQTILPNMMGRLLGLVVFLSPLAHALLQWEESDMNLIVSLQNKPQPKVAPAFGLIPAILPDLLEYIWNAFVNNDVSIYLPK